MGGRSQASGSFLLVCYLEPPLKVPSWPSLGHLCDLLPCGNQQVMLVETARGTPCLTVVPFLVGDRAFNKGAGEVFFKLKKHSRGG